MSGDVQPRKRKDKKKKKDELGVEEPRGTAAALGEGDVFMHYQQDHGTGGHWCAKIIFFSLLAVLITLIGLIILENRGLSELEANSVESRYSGVLEGWIEDSPIDDHHDEHTLELKHHDDEVDEDHHDVEEPNHDDEEDNEESEEHDGEDDHDEEEDHDDDVEEEDEHENDEDLKDEESHEEDTEADEDLNLVNDEIDSNEDQDENKSEENLQVDDNEELEERDTYEQYSEDDEENEDDDKNYDNLNDGNDEQNFDNEDNSYEGDEDDEDDNEYEEKSYDDEQTADQSIEDNNDEYDKDSSKELKIPLSEEITYDNDDDDDSNEQKSYDEDSENDEEQDESQEDDDEEIEKIEKEVFDEDDSNEVLANKNAEDEEEGASQEDNEEEADDGDDDLQDQEDDGEPPLERITAPRAGKPFVEIEEEIVEKPVNTLAEEEEYEKRQEQLRREEEEAAQGSQIWLKLAVGGALLAATHAVLRRAAAPSDIPDSEEHTREETPIVDRRMTIVPEQFPSRDQESPLTQIAREIEEEVFKKPAPVTKAAPIVRQESEEKLIIKQSQVENKAADKELYSDEEEVEEEEEEEEEPVKKLVQTKAIPVVEQKPNDDSEPEDDVEIIDDEQIEEEIEDEEIEDEEEISDVDDAELLTRLEAKYGRLPEPERFGRKPDYFEPKPKPKDGGNSIEDDWPGEPSDAYWRSELNVAEDELRQGEWSACERRVSAPALSHSGRARWIAARALELAAEAKRDNTLLSRAIAAYLHLLKMNERLSDKKLLEVAQRAIDRIQFRGTYLNAEPIYRLLIRRFPADVNYRNNLTITFLMANRADLADEVLKETLRLWPNDRVALAHHGFVLKTHYNKPEDAVKALYNALEGDTGPANEARFYYHLGDALLLLGRPEEAHEVHKRGAALGHFLSPEQRSLYNVPRLRSRPWWSVEATPYVDLALALERSWRDILKEAEAAKTLYEKEKEGLKERGDWTQLDLFVRGAEIPGRCARAPVTCSIVRREAAAARCRRGQVKFSAMAAGTHVRAHVGPTNCRLRMHLGLSNTKDTYIRVNKETRQWQIGKTLLFDDSFEHEVWHNGTGTRLVLIVDVWHPDLSAHERRTLPAI